MTCPPDHLADDVHCCTCEDCGETTHDDDGRCIRCGLTDPTLISRDVCDDCFREIWR